MNTSPADGASNPPSRCRSDLLPEPDAPTIAMRSPARTSRSTPISTGTSSGPFRYVFLRPRQPKTPARAPTRESFIAKRFGGVDARCPPARVDRRREGEQQRNRRDGNHVAALEIGRQVAD